MGKELDISCGRTNGVRGTVVDVSKGILYLRGDDERVIYVVIDKIAFIWEVSDNEPKAGFLT